MKSLACFVLLLQRINCDRKAILAVLAHQTRIRAQKVALIGATIIVLTAPASMAATVTVHPPDSEGRVFVDVVGKIDEGDFQAFKEKTDQIYPIGSGHPTKQVIVTLLSYGGQGQAALQIADWIRKRRFSTFAPADRTCTSACALIWLAGVPRMVGATPRIGFHALYDATTGRETGSGNAVVGGYLRDLGLGYKAIVFMTRKGPTSVEWLTPEVAKEFSLTWEMLQPPRAIPLPPQPKLQPGLQPSPQIIEGWSKWARSSSPQPVPSATASSPPKLFTPPVPFPSSAPAPKQALPTPQVRQPATALEKIQERFESQQANSSPLAGDDDHRRDDAYKVLAQKVVLYEEEPADPNGMRFVGSAVWRTEMVASAPGQPPELAIRADIEVPKRKFAVTWSLRRNTDKSLPATHTVEINFKLPADFPFGGISNVPGMLMKQSEQTRGLPLAGLAIKIKPGFYLIGLSNLTADKDRNLQLLKERGWFDIPVVYSNNRRAILAMEKGPPGERAFADAFKVWEQD